MNIKVVKPNWIKDSFIAGDWLTIDKYELAILDGLRIGVIGFKKAEMIEIVEYWLHRKIYSRKKERL